MMTRTTIDLDPGVLRDLKRLREREGKTLGQLASELLAAALAERKPGAGKRFEWTSTPMGRPAVELEDKEALAALLDER